MKRYVLRSETTVYEMDERYGPMLTDVRKWSVSRSGSTITIRNGRESISFGVVRDRWRGTEQSTAQFILAALQELLRDTEPTVPVSGPRGTGGAEIEETK